MKHFFPEFTHCLEHQLPEDQASPVGLVCPRCKQRLYVQPPVGRGFSCWESQPGAFTVAGDPCFVYTMIWDDFRIRSLHPSGVIIAPCTLNSPPTSVPASTANSEPFLLDESEFLSLEESHEFDPIEFEAPEFGEFESPFPDFESEDPEQYEDF